jgi:hypothetical protein
MKEPTKATSPTPQATGWLVKIDVFQISLRFVFNDLRCLKLEAWHLQPYFPQ